jgi:hypothetical protein
LAGENGGTEGRTLKEIKGEKVVNTRTDWELICIHVPLCVNSTKKDDPSVSAAGPHVCILTLKHDVFAKQCICEYMGHEVTDTDR